MRKKITHNVTQHISKHNRGFTFIESLVAIAILLLAIAGPLYLASQGLRAARIARDQINANYLAQEAIEYIRYRRDNNVLGDNTWLTGLSNCTNGTCVIDVMEENISACDEKTGCPPISFNDLSGLYGYGYGEDAINFGPQESGWVETKFTRSTSINEISPDREAEVITTVSWRDGMINRTYTLKENLLNWQ